MLQCLDVFVPRDSVRESNTGRRKAQHGISGDEDFVGHSSEMRWNLYMYTTPL